MGHQIEAGSEGIYFTDGAWLVVHWCDDVSPPYIPSKDNWAEYMDWADRTSGSTEIEAERVKAADDTIPWTLDEAKAAGFLRGTFRRPIDENTFKQCRKFLHYAAENNLSISGSY